MMWLVQAGIINLLQGKDGEGADKPLPETGVVEDAEYPEDQVEDVGPV